MADSNKRKTKYENYCALINDYRRTWRYFDSEIQKLEEEIVRFREEFMKCASNVSESKSQSSISSASSSKSFQNFYNEYDSVLIQEDGDRKILQFRFDVSQYAPNEIVVKTIDQKLLLHAKHEEQSDTMSVYREYKRGFMLPEGVNPETIRSSLSRKGILTVDAPLPAHTVDNSTTANSQS